MASVDAGAEGIVFFPAGAMVLALFSRAALAQAAADGGTLLKQAQEAFRGGYAGYFAELDGFLWEVAWNPHFQIAEDGAIRPPG